MTLFNRRAIRLLAIHSPLFAAALAGCSRQPAAESTAEQATVVVAMQPVADSGDPKPQPPTPAPAAQPAVQAPAPTFAFPPDLTGRGLSRVVAPNVSRPLAVERFGIAPEPRSVPAKVLNPDATTRARYAPLPDLPPKSAAAKPAALREKVPVDLGAGADGVPAKPVLPTTAGVTERSRNVNLPPPAPVLGRPVVDRVSLDDPTSELGNAAVVAGGVKVPLSPSAFQKVTIPDPFELAEQVKPKVPATAEPSAVPVPVNPQRVK